MSSSTIVSGLAVDLDGRGYLALCRHCLRQREGGGAELEAVPGAAVISGCCADCGGGFCLCGGAVYACERCPRRNAPLILSALGVYVFVIPPVPSTVPAPLGDS